MSRRWLVFSLLIPSSAFGQVAVTEVLPNPATVNDEAEWIELQNLGTSSVDLAGWTLNDFTGAGAQSESPTRWAFPAGARLAPSQVIVVANFASGPGFLEEFGRSADYELGSTRDDLSVPNMIAVSGTQLIMLNNGTDGDGVLLRDASGNIIDGVEWGLDKLVTGSPASQPAQGQSLIRIQRAGTSVLDFTVTIAPTPGVGLDTGPAPALLSPRRSALAIWGQPFSVWVDSSVSGTQTWLTFGAAATGPSQQAWGGRAMSASTSGEELTVTLGTDLPQAADPATFHDQYVRWFHEARSGTLVTTLPTNATPDFGNAAFFWDNVVPSSAVTPISVARAQDAGGVPTWLHHAVRVEGIALTQRSAFQSAYTDFFVSSTAGTEAIHVFDAVLVAANVQPGDRVRVIGRIGVHRGLRQLGVDQRTSQPIPTSPQIVVEVIGNTQVPIVSLTATQVLQDPEGHESQLIQVSGLELVADPNTGAPAPRTWTAESAHYASDGGATLAIWIPRGNDLTGAPTPSAPFTLRAIVSQYSDNPATGHQLLPRSAADVIASGQPDAGSPDGSAWDSGPSDAAMPPDGANHAGDAGLGSDAGGTSADASLASADTGTTRADGSTAGPSGRGGGTRAADRGGCTSGSADVPLWLGVPALVLDLAKRRRRGR